MEANEWQEATLGDVCLKITDGAHSSPPSVEEGFPMASVKDMSNYGINIASARKISAENFQKLIDQDCRPIKDDILVAKDGAKALETVCIQNDDASFVLLSSVAILRPNKEIICPQFLKYYLQSCRTLKYMKTAFFGGAAIPRVVLKDFFRAKIKFPALPKQKVISSFLLSYDDLIENNQRRIRILEEMAQSLYREWFVYFRYPGHENVPLTDRGSSLGPIPNGWEIKELGDLVDVPRRSVMPGDLNQKTPYVGLEHIPRKQMILNGSGSLSGVTSTKLSFCKNEILFGKIRPYFHKVVIAPYEGVASSDAIIISVKDEKYLWLVFLTVFSESFVNHATQTSNGTKMPRANWNVLQKYPVPVPSDHILENFNEMMQPSFDLANLLMNRTQNLKETRDLFLPKLISGEIEISDVTMPKEEVA